VFVISGEPGDVVTFSINTDNAQTLTIGPSGNETIIVSAPASDVVLSLVQVARANCIELLSETATVAVTQVPVASAGADVEACEGAAVSMSASAFPSAIYEWEASNGFQTTGLDVVITNATTADNGAYYLTASIGACVDYDTVNVTVWPTVTTVMPAIAICNDIPYEFLDGIIISNDTTITFTYTSESHGCDSSVVWTFIELDEIVMEPQVIQLCPDLSYTFPDGTIGDSTGMYEIVLTSLTGCDSLIIYEIQVSSPIESNVQVPPLCYGEVFDLGNGEVAAESGFYTVELVALNSCDSIVNYSVAILPELQSEFAAVACAGDQYQLPDATVVNEAGEYEVYLQGQLGCDSLVRVLLTYVPQVLVSIIPETDSIQVCEGDTMMLIADGAGNYSWNSHSGDLISTQGTMVDIAPMEDSWVVLTGSNEACFARDSIYFTVNAPPDLDIVAPNAICLGDSALISVSGSDSIVWSNDELIGCTNCIENIIRPSESEELIVGGWNGECYSTVSFEIEVQVPPSASVFGDTQVCASNPAELFADGGDSYTWSTGQTGSAITVNPGQTSIYYVVALSGICTDTAMITVEATPLPQIITSGDTTITLGGQAQLQVQGGINYYWSPSSTLSCEACDNPIASPSETTTYCVQAMSDFGCESTSCLKVEVIDECQSFFIPNAFAPERGGHEMNDCFHVFGEECFADMRLRVFDRWGEMVFEASSFDDCWDGNYQGRKVDAGVFVYYFDGTLVNGESFTRKGNVTVIR